MIPDERTISNKKENEKMKLIINGEEAYKGEEN